ncbi:MAG: CARDB domain-containing protein [Myxococcales bacterium]
MTKRIAMTLVAVAIAAGSPAAAQAQMLYLATAPTVATPPTYTTWTSFTLLNSSGSAGGDSGIATLAIPFPFSFYGKTYTSLDINLDGLIMFENATKICTGSYSSKCCTANDLPDAAAPNGVIAFWWDDGASSTGTGKWAVSGSPGSQIFAIKLENWGSYSYSSPISPRTVEIDLHEDNGAIDIYYGAISSPTASDGEAEVGIEDSTGSQGVLGMSCSNTTSYCDNTQWPAGKVISFAPAVKPDLSVTGVYGSALVPTTVNGNPGYTVDVQVTAKNQGLNPAVGFGFDVYLCNQATVTTTDPTKCQFLRSHPAVETVNGRQDGTFSETGLTFTKPAAGTFYLGVVLDPTNAVDEVLEGNNTGVGAGYLIGSVDLTGTVTGPAKAAPGENVRADVRIINRGTEVVTATFKYQLYLSTKNTLNKATDPLLYVGDVAGLGGGETRLINPPAVLPSPLAEGEYYYHLVIDSTSAVTEVSEANNGAVTPSSITISATDLLVKDVSVHDITPPNAVTTAAYFGEKVRLEFTLANQGGGTASDFNVCILLSDTTVISLFDQNITPAGAPLTGLTYLGAESHDFAIELTIPTEKAPGVPLPDGQYWIGVVADCLSKVKTESNKANNKSAIPNPIYVRQAAPDYLPTELQSPAAGAAGEVMPVYRVLRNLGNRGNLDGAAALLKYQYYLSSNDIISPEDIPVSVLDSTGEAHPYGLIRLGPGDVHRTTESVLVPASLSPGTYYVGVIVDPLAQEFELDETNNALGSLGTVEIAGNSLSVETRYLPDALVGVNYLQQLVASGIDGPGSWSLAPDQGELPPGLTLSADGLLEGMPAADGAFVFTVRVQSGNREALARLAMRVVEPTGALQVVSSKLPTAVRGQAYAINLSAVGGVRPYTWLLEAGALPDGLVLDPAGKISGKLTRAYGNLAFSVSVNDVFGTKVVAELSMRAVEPGTLFVATTSLQKAQVGATFRQQLASSGGTGPFTWTVLSGGLPDGLRLTGDSIMGSPTKTGYFPVVLQVADSAGFSDEGSFILNVLPRPAAFTMPDLPELKVGGELSINLSLYGKAHSTFAIYGGRLPPGITLEREGRLAGTVGEDAAPGSYDALLLVHEESGAEALFPLTLRVLSKPWVPTTTTGGGGCSAGGAGLMPLFGLFALVPLLWRRRGASAVALAVAAACTFAAPGAARAEYRLWPQSTKTFEPLVGGTAVTLESSASQASVALPFGFKVYGEAFNSVNVGCRGYLAFGTGSATKAQSLGIPSTSASYNFPLIAPWWGSWECQTGAVSYLISGVTPQRVVTFQWDHVWYTPDTGGTTAHGATFQAKLYETSNRIEFSYGPSSMDAYEPPESTKAPKAAVGVQGSGGKTGMPGLSCTYKQPASVSGDGGVITPSGAQCGVGDFVPNQLITFTQLGDLTLTRLYADDEGYAGAPLRMGATVLNQGGELSKDVSVKFYLSTDNALDTTKDTELGSTRAMDVDVQQRRDVVVSLMLPATLTGSTFYLFAVVDPEAKVEEENEANNKSTALAVALGKPKADLVVGEVLVDKATARAGETLQVTRTLENQGNALSGPCATQAECGSGRTCDAGRCRKTCGGPSDCEANLTCTRGICDTPACTSSDVCLAGEACNAGMCVAKPISYVIYLSENPVVTLADRRLFPATRAAQLASGIPAFSEATGTDRVTLPSDLGVGQYYVGVIVNPEADLPEVLVVNNAGSSASPLTVVSDTLALPGATLPDAQMGAPYSVHLQASGGDGAYTFSLAAGASLPAGLTLKADGDIAGVPTAATDTVAFEVKVASAGKTATGQYLLKVVPANLPLTLVSQDIPAAEFGKAYKTSLAAVGGRPPYRWALAAGAQLPAGVALGQDGTLEGAPLKDGSFAFGVEVLDAKGSLATTNLTLVVIAPDRLTIATKTLPDAYLGKSYSGPLQAVGGKAPYTWSVFEVQQVPSEPTEPIKPSATRLPEPLQVVTDKVGARIQGVPTVVGTYVVTLKVVDLSGAEDNATFVLNIRYERGLEIVTVALPDAIAGKTYTARLGTGEADPALVAWSITCSPIYKDGVLQPCTALPPPGIQLAADGTLASTAVVACNEPAETPKGCPEGLTCTSEGTCVLKEPDADPETGSIPARTLYSFLVRAQDTKSGRFAVKALSVTLRVDEPPPQPKTSSGCSSAAGLLALWPAALGLLPMLRRRSTRPAARRALGLVSLLAGALVALSCGGNKTPTPVTRCDKVTCSDGLTCDPGDGLCKCGGEGGVFCASGGVCSHHVCVYSCDEMVCDRGMTLDPLDCKCKCGLQQCEANQSCDTTMHACYVPSKCVNVICAGGMGCDPNDGVCKCGGVSCAGGQVCAAGKCTSEPCGGVSCSGGALCDPADGLCKCGGSAGRACTFGELCACPGAASCTDEERRCAQTDRCANKVCAGSTTCDPADGQCRCGGPGGPVCQSGQSCDVLRKVCLGGDRCSGVTCGTSLACDPEDGVCKCGGINGVNGTVCVTGEICAHFNDGARCVLACDPLQQKCPAGQACYFDIYARVASCDTAGTNVEGAGCRVIGDCGKGLHCQQLAGQTGICRRYCKVPDGASGCPQANQAQECYQLSGAEKDVGACDSSAH